MKKLNGQEIITLAHHISHLPDTDEGTAPHIADLLQVYKVEYAREDDQVGLTTFETPESEANNEWDEWYILDLLHAAGDYNEAIRLAVNFEINSTSTPIRCTTLSNLYGFWGERVQYGIFSSNNTFTIVYPSQTSPQTYTVTDFIFHMLSLPGVDNEITHYLTKNLNVIQDMPSGYYYVNFTYYPPQIKHQEPRECTVLLHGTSPQDIEDKFYQSHPMLKTFNSHGYMIDKITPMTIKEAWLVDVNLQPLT